MNYGISIGSKAGGIRDFDTVRKMVEAGAARIGASASAAIVGAISGRVGAGDSPACRRENPNYSEPLVGLCPVGHKTGDTFFVSKGLAPSGL